MDGTKAFICDGLELPVTILFNGPTTLTLLSFPADEEIRLKAI
jgi:hypothetical protein